MKNGAVYNFYQRPFFDMMNMRQHSKWMAMQNCNHHPHNEGQAVAPQYDAPLK